MDILEYFNIKRIINTESKGFGWCLKRFEDEDTKNNWTVSLDNGNQTYKTIYFKGVILY